MRILLVEDNVDLAEGMSRRFRSDGFNVDTFDHVEFADEALRQQNYAVIVLDIMLADGSGLDLLTGLRRRGDKTPVLMLTALDGVSDRIRGLDAGADDYLTKPFDTDELLARIRALLRRRETPIVKFVEVGPISIDVEGRTAVHGSETLPLSRTEFLLFECLARNENRVCSKDQIAQAIYSYDDDWNDKAIEVHIHRLRKKLSVVVDAPSIKSLRGLGYMMHRERNGG